jgi:uncharacterized protein YecE (DUF72 family)
MLHFYAGRLNAVEINYTFHHMPTAGVLASWTEQVPDDFAFALKAPQVITHFKQLRNVGEETDYFFRILSMLGGKLGPVLFEFAKSFNEKKNRPVLEEFLSLIPPNLRCAFEFRSPTWLEAGITDLLRERGCSLCVADSDESPTDAIISTTSWGYLRLRRSDYTEADLREWLEKIRAQPWERVFVFFKHEEEATGTVTGPEMALRFRELAEASQYFQKEESTTIAPSQLGSLAPAHLRGLLRHFADLRDGTHGDGAVTRVDKEKLFKAAVKHLARDARQALTELNDSLLLGSGTLAATDVLAATDGGVAATWTLAWPEQEAARIPPVTLQAFFGPGFHHPHLRGGTVGNWPLNVFSKVDAAAELPTLRAIAAAELHNLDFQADYRIVPAITRNTG